MTQGETLEELEENLKEAYLLMALDDSSESAWLELRFGRRIHAFAE